MEHIIETNAYNRDSYYSQESKTLEEAIEEMVQDRWILLARIHRSDVGKDRHGL